MSTTAMYKALIEAEVSEETAERAVEGLHFAGEVATKADLKAEIAALEARMTWRLVLASGFIIGAVGLMLRAMLPVG